MMRLSSDAARALAERVVDVADADRLGRGRTYQRKGYASVADVMPGAAMVTVAGSSSEPYQVTVAVREAGENVRAAAAEDVAAAVPGAGDVGFSCTCPDWGDPCKHGVAALLELARAVDDDPGLLLRWRGIDDVVPPAPPGTGPLVDADDGGPVSFDSLAALDALAESHRRVGATSVYDPDDEPALDSFGRPRGSGRGRKAAGRAASRWGDDLDDDLGGEVDGDGDRFSRGFGVDAVPEIPGPGDAAREIRRRFASERPAGATAEERLADLRRRLGADLVDPADVAAAELRARADADASADGPLGRFFGHDLAEVIDPPPPLEVVPLDAYHHVRIMVETTDAAPVIADALETITDHWLTR